LKTFTFRYSFLSTSVFTACSKYFANYAGKHCSMQVNTAPLASTDGVQERATHQTGIHFIEE